MFEDIAEAIAERPPEEKAFIETRFVRRTGMLPAALRDKLIGGMHSHDPTAQIAAAVRLARLQEIDPMLTAEIPEDLLSSDPTT